MKLSTGIMPRGGTTEYPFLSMLIAVCMVLLSPFVTAYLNYIAFLIFLYRMLRYDAKVFVADYCVLMPITQVFITEAGMSLVIWLCFVAAIWHFVRGKIKVNMALLCLLLILNYLIVRMQMVINSFALCFGQMFVLYSLLPKQDAESAEKATKLFCASLVLTSVYALVFRRSPQLVAICGEEKIAIWGTSITRFRGLYKDPNYYSTLLAVGLALLCKLKESGRIGILRFLIYGLAFTIFGILTYSKSFFLIFILIGGIYIIWQFWSKRVFKGVFVASVVVIAGLFLLLSENSPFAVVIARLTSGKTFSDLTTGRSDLFILHWNAISKNLLTLLFGLGFRAPEIENGPHNLYLEITYYTGIVGLTLIMAFYCSMVTAVQKNNPAVKRQNLIAKYVVIFIILIHYFSLHGMFQIITYAGLFLAILSVNLTRKKSNG